MKKSVKFVAALTLSLATMLTACSGSSAKTDSTKSASKTGSVTTSTAKTSSDTTSGSADAGSTTSANTSGATKLDLSTITGAGDKLD